MDFFFSLVNLICCFIWLSSLEQNQAFLITQHSCNILPGTKLSGAGNQWDMNQWQHTERFYKQNWSTTTGHDISNAHVEQIQAMPPCHFLSHHIDTHSSAHHLYTRIHYMTPSQQAASHYHTEKAALNKTGTAMVRPQSNVAVRDTMRGDEQNGRMVWNMCVSVCKLRADGLQQAINTDYTFCSDLHHLTPVIQKPYWGWGRSTLW